MAKGKRIYTGEEVKVKIYSTDEEVAFVVNKRSFDKAYDWDSDPQALDILPRYIIQQMIDASGGGGSSALTFVDTVDSEGNVDLSGKTGMPAAGAIPNALRSYHGVDFDEDNSTNTTYRPSTQKVFVGLDEGTEVQIKITF